MKSRRKAFVPFIMQPRSFLALLSCGLILCLIPASASAIRSSEQTGQVRPPTTNADIIQALNLDFPCMEKVTAAIAANNLEAAKRAYLEFRRTARAIKCSTMPAATPAQPAKAAGVLIHHIHTSAEDMDVAIVNTGGAKSFTLKSKLAGKVETLSEGLVLRRTAGQKTVLAGGWDLSSFASKGLELTTDAPAELLICLRANRPALINAGREPVHVYVKKPFEQRISLMPSNAVELGPQGAVRINDTSIFALQPDRSSAGQR